MAWIIPLARGGAKLNAFMNSDLTYKQSKQRAADLLNTNEILQIVQGLTREDQKEFVDKLDQVCLTLPVGIFPVHHSREDIPDCRLAKCETPLHFRGGVQGKRAFSNFGRPLHTAQETW